MGCSLLQLFIEKCVFDFSTKEEKKGQDVYLWVSESVRSVLFPHQKPSRVPNCSCPRLCSLMIHFYHFHD